MKNATPLLRGFLVVTLSTLDAHFAKAKYKIHVHPERHLVKKKNKKRKGICGKT